jgi:S1-C subfamily serine protease
MENNLKKTFIAILAVSIIVSSIFGGIMGFWAGTAAQGQWNLAKLFNSGVGATTVKVTDQESAVVQAVDKVSPAVVSIIISKNLPKIQPYSNPFNSDFFNQFFGSDFPNFFTPQTPQNNSQPSQGRLYETDERATGAGQVHQQAGPDHQRRGTAYCLAQ